MERYLFIFRGGDAARAQESPETWQAHMQKWGAWMKGLAEKQILEGGEPLEVDGKQVNGKNKMVIDGPFMEAKETVGGYLIVKAGSLNEATEISKGCPILEHDGKVEIRQLKKVDMPM
jgi:hypothetical protein